MNRFKRYFNYRVPNRARIPLDARSISGEDDVNPFMGNVPLLSSSSYAPSVLITPRGTNSMMCTPSEPLVALAAGVPTMVNRSSLYARK
jgi:hypothetical protein